MNYGVSVIFRAIPLAMMAVCFGFGLYVWTAGDEAGNFVAGRVVTFLGVICLCLFCTAATIIRQLIGRYTALDRVIWPTIGYLAATGTAAYGAYLFVGASSSGLNDHYVAGHVVFGLGLISGCVATVAAASTKFSLIPENSRQPKQIGGFPRMRFSGLPCWCWVPYPSCSRSWPGRSRSPTWSMSTTPSRFTVGHVVAGLALICTSLIGLGLEHPPPGAEHATANGIGSSGLGS